MKALENKIALMVHSMLFALIDGYVDIGPGKIPKSYYISTSETFVCPIVKETDSDGEIQEVSLKVTHCPVSSGRGYSCPGYNDPVDYTLTKGNGPQIIAKGNKYYYQTSQLAQFFGNKVCISFPYYTYTTLRKGKIAECRSKCFKSTYGPITSDRMESSLGSFAGNGYRYDVTSSSYLEQPALLLLLVTSFLGLSSNVKSIYFNSR